MTSRTCYLHVGTPKTGTTTIQGFLRTHRRELAARGLDVPTFPERSVVAGARAFANAIKLEPDPAAPATSSWRWLDRHIAATRGDFCISRESLSTEFSKEGRFERTHAFFALRGVRLKVIGYVRDTPERINSAYTQHAKKLRVSAGFERWAWNIRPDHARKYSPWRVFERPLATDGVELVVRVYDSARDRLVADFLAQVGQSDVDLSGFDDAPFRNATPGPKGVAAALIVTRALEERGTSPEIVRAYADVFEEALAARGWREAPFFGPDQAFADRLTALFDPENDLFARAAWGTSWLESVPRRARPRHVFDRARAGVAETAEVDDLARETLALGDALQRPWRRALSAMARSFGRATATAPSAPRG